MKILIVGGGGREHALAWRVANNPKGIKHRIFCAPGNAGMKSVAELVPVQATDVEGLCAFAKSEGIDYTIIGVEAALELGVADRFIEEGLKVFGPVKAAAMLETSKAYAKGFMKKYGIPTAEYEIFDTYQAAVEYIRKSPLPVVVKADGLAVGKGACVCGTREEAEMALKEIMVEKRFGKSGNRVVIEKILEGKETTVMAFCDGEHIVPMVSAKDYKKVYNGDAGPNTGGMGAISPSPFYTERDAERFEREIMFPTLNGLKAEGLDYVGCIYFELMLTNSGPCVIEYNTRFGDPETQVVLPRLMTDFIEICLSCANKTLDKIELKWDNRESTCVCMASEGYPSDYEIGFAIEGLNDVEKEHGEALIFYAGVKSGKSGKSSPSGNEESRLETAGGRVLGVTGIDGSGLSAKKAYEAARLVSFKGMHYRTDIGSI